MSGEICEYRSLYKNGQILHIIHGVVEKYKIWLTGCAICGIFLAKGQGTSPKTEWRSNATEA